MKCSRHKCQQQFDELQLPAKRYMEIGKAFIASHANCLDEDSSSQPHGGKDKNQ